MVAKLDDARGAESAEKWITLKPTEWQLYERAKEIYRSPLTFIREVLQNSSDSGAENVLITIDDKKIVIEDDGSGMSREFLIDEFKKIGGNFKTGEERGRLGEGRTSLFIPIMESVYLDGRPELRYNGHVEIETSNRKDKTLLLWKTLASYRVEDKGPTTEKGTKITITSDRDGKLPNENQVKKYIRENIVGVGVNIEINKHPVRLPLGSYEKVCAGSQRFDNSSISTRFKVSLPSFRYTIGVNESKSLVIAERGIVVESIENDVLGGVIDFSGSVHKGEKVGITSLSRDSTVLDKSQIYYTFLMKGGIKYYRDLGFMSAYAQQETAANIVHALMQEKPRPSIREKAAIKGLINDVFVLDSASHAVRLGELKEQHMGKVVWADSNNRSDVSLSEKAGNKGYEVLQTQSYKMQMVFKMAGVSHISSLSKKLKVPDEEMLESYPDKGALKMLRGYLTVIGSVIKESDVRSQQGKILRERMKKGAERAASTAAVIAIAIAASPAIAAKWVYKKTEGLKERIIDSAHMQVYDEEGYEEMSLSAALKIIIKERSKEAWEDLKCFSKEDLSRVPGALAGGAIAIGSGFAEVGRRIGSKGADGINFLRSHTKSLSAADVADAFGDFAGFVTDKGLKVMRGSSLHLYLQENEDKKLVTFSYHGGVALNKNNDYVNEMIDAGRADLLLPDVVKQIVEDFGYLSYSQKALDAEGKILVGVNLRLAKREIITTQKANVEDNKNVLPPISLTQKDLELMGLKRGQFAQVILSPAKFKTISAVAGEMSSNRNEIDMEAKKAKSEALSKSVRKRRSRPAKTV
jgi:hypothetical protein